MKKSRLFDEKEGVIRISGPIL